MIKDLYRYKIVRSHIYQLVFLTNEFKVKDWTNTVNYPAPPAAPPPAAPAEAPVAPVAPAETDPGKEAAPEALMLLKAPAKLDSDCATFWL